MNLNELIKKKNQVKGEIENNENEEDELLIEGEVIQLVSFLLDKVEYGVDILSVHEILRIHEITRLPNTPDFIKGVINLRGNVIPVVDVRLRFGFPEADYTDLTRIIVIENEGKQVGLLVDNVHQVVRIGQASVDSPDELLEGVSQEFIKGIGRMKNRLIILLNMTNILFLEDEQV